MCQCAISTVSFTGLDHCYLTDYFESILATIEASLIFRGSWGSSENMLELKIEPPLSNLACLRNYSAGMGIKDNEKKYKLC